MNIIPTAYPEYFTYINLLKTKNGDSAKNYIIPDVITVKSCILSQNWNSGQMNPEIQSLLDSKTCTAPVKHQGKLLINEQHR